MEPVALEPGEIRDLSAEAFAATQDLARLQSVTTGAELTSAGGPGTLLAAAESVSLDGDQVFRVPLIDPQTKGAAGNYPWRVDGDVSTVVYLKNVTSESRDYTVQFDFDGGSYIVGLDTLDPGETVAIDVRELRDSQRPDVHGTVIPPDASRRQVHWSAQGEGAQHSMLGRAEYVNAGRGFSSTFACSSCCSDSVVSTWLDPFSDDITAGDQTAFQAFQQNQNCYGGLLTPYVIFNVSWTSSDSNTIGSLGNGSFQGFLPGTDQFSSDGHPCQDDGVPCDSYLRTLTYTIKDQFGDTFGPFNFFAHESLDNWAGCPHSNMHFGDIQGVSTGFTDNFYLCSESCPGCGSQGQGCDMTANQTWYVNGFDVRVGYQLNQRVPGRRPK